MRLTLLQRYFAPAAIITLMIAACSTSIERRPVPLDQIDSAEIPHMRGVRYWADAPPPDLNRLLAKIKAQQKAGKLGPERTMLALSGGGDDGAYNAGILNAWSRSGTRPEFTVVTGVSTGAIIAPFAFLGSEYDRLLQMAYGGVPPEGIYRRRDLLGILLKASAADDAPLADLLARVIDEKMLRAVAREHARGRRLLVQTTDLDAQRAMLWDLGAIASSGAPNALAVFRSAILASASMPVTFPPVLFDVEVNGEIFDEMHVDGGTVSELTVLSGWQRQLAGKLKGLNVTFYVIRNGYVSPQPESTKYALLPIAERSISTLIKSHGAENLVTAYDAAKAQGANFRATWIGEEFSYPEHEPFDHGYMQALFDYGFRKMQAGEVWHDRPPQLEGSGKSTGNNLSTNYRLRQ